MKTDIFNLIILDESGSMSGVTKQTISGCNETINTIRAAHEKFAETQNHYVSIYAFQENDSVPSRYLVKNEPIEKVEHITDKDYRPSGCTPLLDAIGSTLVDLKLVVDEKELAVGVVTIITDGYENASRHYTYEKIVKMIDSFKEIGWTFNFIGADIDVAATAHRMHMDSHLEFAKTAEGATGMFDAQNNARMRDYDRKRAIYEEERRKAHGGRVNKKNLFKLFRIDADKYFDENEEDKKE